MTLVSSRNQRAQNVVSSVGEGDGKFKVGHAGIVIIDSKGKTSYFDFGRYTRPDIKRKRGTDEGAVRSSKNFSQLRIPDWNFSKTEEENVTAILTSLHYSTIFKGYGTIMGALAKGLNYQPMLNYARKAESMGYLPFGGYSCGYNLLSCGSYCAKFARGVGDAGGIDWDWDTFTGEANIESLFEFLFFLSSSPFIYEV
ncbi:DUF6695 family protein [Bernardetia sp. Wsw4-3y2]|uniref:DUF6695 family protein n=1 Tax=Bernardetia sp. Wsw4-3y2 TaxID=3127471 RepID=UPI0030CB6165